MTFTVLGPASTKGLTRSFVRGGRVVTLADADGLGAWTQAVKWAARAARVELIPRPLPVSVMLQFEFVSPKSDPDRKHHTVKPDIDKMIRASLDALAGLAYEDDSQVVVIMALKRYGAVAATHITVGAA